MLNLEQGRFTTSIIGECYSYNIVKYNDKIKIISLGSYDSLLEEYDIRSNKLLSKHIEEADVTAQSFIILDCLLLLD